MIVGSSGAPPNVKAVSGSAGAATGPLTVSFTAGANNGSAITGYTATCTSPDGGVAGSQTGTASPIVVSGLTTAKTYTCTVRATNARGAGLASAPSLPVIVGSPAAPTNVSAVKVVSGQLTVSITAGANNGSAITSFTATCTSSDGGVAGSQTGTASPLIVTGLTTTKTYT
ncbi:MAG: fibronectin type III domain-containing protein, partial [Actinomycetota bacterium]|nr:fibronectin type III domain-containing protein [Actinomycetota bacterium]